MFAHLFQQSIDTGEIPKQWVQQIYVHSLKKVIGRWLAVKCNIMQITRKRIKKINASYNLQGIVRDNVENIKYLGITITKDLK